MVCANSEAQRYGKKRVRYLLVSDTESRSNISQSWSLTRKVLPMGFQGAIENLMKVFLTFFIGCCLIGRPDLPLKAITQLRAKALSGTSASWGCPSLFNRGSACSSFDARRYK